MKKLILFILLLLFSCGSTSKGRTKRDKVELPEKDRIRILLAKTDPKIYDLVKEKFEGTGKYRIISQEDQSKAVSKLKDCSTKECTFELGKVLFAKLLLTFTSETVLNGDYTVYSYKIADVNQGVYLASSYDIIYSAGATKYVGEIYKLHKAYLQYAEDEEYVPNNVQSIREQEERTRKKLETLNELYTKKTSYYDTFQEPKPPLKVNQAELIDNLLDSLETKLEAKKNTKKSRIVFVRNGFFEELFKSEMILYEELELIDDMTIEKTLNQLKKKQQCGVEDCDVQLGKIFLADFLFSTKTIRTTPREVQSLPQIYDMKKGKFKNFDFIQFYETYYTGDRFKKAEIIKKSLNLPPLFSNVEPKYQYPFEANGRKLQISSLESRKRSGDEEIDYVVKDEDIDTDCVDGKFPRKEAIRKKRILDLANFIISTTIDIKE